MPSTEGVPTTVDLDIKSNQIKSSCPDGTALTSIDDCDAAAKALGLEETDAFYIPNQSMTPSQCSYGIKSTSSGRGGSAPKMTLYYNVPNRGGTPTACGTAARDNGQETCLCRSSQCAPCPAGKYQSADDECASCPTGKYQPDSGKLGCIPVPAGTVQKPGDPSAVETCPAGKFAVSSGSIACAACSGTGQCATCPAGKVPGGTGQMCIDCPAGKFTDKPSSGEYQCESCPPTGAYRSLQRDQPCVLCEPGKYNDVGPLAATCKSCPIGKAWGPDLESEPQLAIASYKCRHCGKLEATESGFCKTCGATEAMVTTVITSEGKKLTVQPKSYASNIEDEGKEIGPRICQACPAGKRKPELGTLAARNSDENVCADTAPIAIIIPIAVGVPLVALIICFCCYAKKKKTATGKGGRRQTEDKDGRDLEGIQLDDGNNRKTSSKDGLGSQTIESPAPSAPYIPQAVPVESSATEGRAPVSIADELQKLDGLRKSGVLSAKEFENAKTRLLA